MKTRGALTPGDWLPGFLTARDRDAAFDIVRKVTPLLGTVASSDREACAYFAVTLRQMSDARPQSKALAWAWSLLAAENVTSGLHARGLDIVKRSDLPPKTINDLIKLLAALVAADGEDLWAAAAEARPPEGSHRVDWLARFICAPTRDDAVAVLMMFTKTQGHLPHEFGPDVCARYAAEIGKRTDASSKVLAWAWAVLSQEPPSILLEKLAAEGEALVASARMLRADAERCLQRLRMWPACDDPDIFAEAHAVVDEDPELPTPLYLLRAFSRWDEAGRHLAAISRLLEFEIDLTDREKSREHIERAIQAFSDIPGGKAGGYVLAWRMLLVDPTKPESFHGVMPALEILLGDAGAPADLRRKLDVWWRCARGDFRSATTSAFHLANREQDFRDRPTMEDLAEPLVDDDETRKTNSWSRTPKVPPNSVVVMKSMNASEKSGVSSIWTSLAGKHLPIKIAGDVAAVRAALRDEYPHAVGVVDALLRDLRDDRAVRFKPTILVGSPGSGKSRLVRRLAELLGGLSVYRYDAAGTHDGMFSGSPKTWSNSQPSVPARAIMQAQCANPVVMLDEIEKAGSGTYNGRLWDCLVPFLERETSARYRETGLDAELDLSHVSYIATANSVDALPGPLRDRFRILRVPSPTLAHLPALARHVMSDLARGDEERSHDAPLADDELAVIGRAWTREKFSMRKLQRLVGATLQARDSCAPRH